MNTHTHLLDGMIHAARKLVMQMMKLLLSHIIYIFNLSSHMHLPSSEN